METQLFLIVHRIIIFHIDWQELRKYTIMMEPSADHFIVTLLSDSAIGNTAAKFSSHLPYPIEVDDSWEVGLWSCILTRSWLTFDKDQTITLYWDRQDPENSDNPKRRRTRQPAERIKFVNIPKAYYPNTAGLIKEIERLCHGAGELWQGIKLIQDGITHRVTVISPPGLAVRFPDVLARLLGFEQDITVVVPRTGQPVPSLDPVSFLHIYADIIAPQIVGNIEAPLLQIVPIKAAYGETFKYAPLNVSYLGLSAKTVSTVNIEISDNKGKIISFADGSVSCLQHRFRRRV